MQSRPAVFPPAMFRSVVIVVLVICGLVAWSSALFFLEGDSFGALFDTGTHRDSGLEFGFKTAEPLDYDATRMDVTQLSPTIPLRIVTFNVRYATSSPVKGEKRWKDRGPKLLNQLGFITAGHENAFLCLQEVLHEQLEDIQASLGPRWASIGRAREDGKQKGEYSPVFYRSDVWYLERSQTRWLSPTPEKPSRGWGASHNRVVTMGDFTHRGTGTRVVVMSTHFDHKSAKARQHSAQQLMQYAREWGVDTDEAGDGDGGSSSSSISSSAVLIGGDFNSTPDDVAYRLMTAPGSGMSDLAALLPEDQHNGNSLTYTSFGEDNEWPQRIDFLFIQEPRTAVVKTFSVLENIFDDQIRISDHRPVVSDLEIAVDPSS
ncbi:DNase I-like protein [Trichoderma citrinoviride]|uniref:DNase I-like protein n=1 Tax=Trichoderma citrinoviride TaxID=58853 RepID=A0A2T4B2H1_9HYPO|nr:DNase I-like protein [Trichoderma citrinoviride]PTB63516.1 DNase I-like protein [Trichoderma citrinoviride]